MNMRKEEQEEENTQQQASSSVTHTTFVSDTPVSFYSSVSPYAILIGGGVMHMSLRLRAFHNGCLLPQ